mgnify:CR=1 FL=1
MSHVYAARYVLPQMLDRKSGYFLQIISAAALLSQVGASAYSATKSAALSFAESLAINYGMKGIKVSAVCPQYVATPMLGFKGKSQEIRNKNLISPEEAANCIIKGVNKEIFLIVTDSKVMPLFKEKCRNYERWISGMQRLNNKVVDENKDGGYITPLEAEGDYLTFISRIRKDHSNKKALNMWIVSDNLLKGAALNTVQIAECLMKKK